MLFFIPNDLRGDDGGKLEIRKITKLVDIEIFKNFWDIPFRLSAHQ